MERIPFLLTPSAKDYLWGGSRLNDIFNLNINISPFAEAWVCSSHPCGQSIVSSTGEKLGDLLKSHPEWLGFHAASLNNGELPIMIKLIDAQKNLSVQVHPNDEYAKINESSLGKTELWYIIDASKDSKLVYGFNKNVDERLVREAILSGTIPSLLNLVPVKKNDLFYIEAGTVHAIGAGCLIAEIQESSNLTYRLYDYGRVDKNGNTRELHVDKAISVMNMDRSMMPRQPLRVLKYHAGYASELLARCKYFQVERILLNTENRKLANFQTGANSFHSLLCIAGCGSISGNGVNLDFYKGDCIFVPSESIPLKLHGQAQLLNVSC